MAFVKSRLWKASRHCVGFAGKELTRFSITTAGWYYGYTMYNSFDTR